MEKENKTKNTGRSYLSLIGGAIALLAFFAPWAGCNRGRNFWGSAGPPPNMRGPSELSGADLAADKPEFYIALVAALIIVIVFLFFMYRKQLGKSRWPIIISSVGGIIFLIAEYINLQGQEMAELVTLRWGAFVTLFGFLLALIGVPFLKQKLVSGTMQDISNGKHSINTYCSNCGKPLDESDSKFCPFCGKRIEQ